MQPVFQSFLLACRLSLVGSWFLMCPFLSAQEVDSLGEAFTDTSLMQGWESWQGDSWKPQPLPFTVPPQEELVLRYPLMRPDCPPDTVYLVWEGVAWEATLELNDYLIGVHRDPFGPWKIALPAEWLQPGKNWLSLQLRPEDLPQANLPEPFLGIFRPVSLLDSLHAARRMAFTADRPETADTVALIAPYYRQAVWQFDTVEALRSLRAVCEAGIRHVYFWQEPDRSLLRMVDRLGLAVVRQLADTTQVALINAYPYAVSTFTGGGDFWLDERGARTRYYGLIRSWGRAPYAQQATPLGLLGVLLILAPLLGAFVVRLIKPGFFFSQPQLLMQPSLSVDSPFLGGDASGGRGYVLLTLIRLLLLSCVLSLGMHYLVQAEIWGQLRWLRGDSLLLQIFTPRLSLGEIWLRASLLIGLLEGGRYLFVGMIGWVFRIKDLTLQVMGVDIAAAYPLVYFLSLPLALLWGSSPRSFSWIWLLMGLLMGVYWLRRLYLNFRSLGGGRAFSLGMKFLYVCTFNIALLLIWL